MPALRCVVRSSRRSFVKWWHDAAPIENVGFAAATRIFHLTVDLAGINLRWSSLDQFYDHRCDLIVDHACHRTGDLTGAIWGGAVIETFCVGPL